MTDQFLLRTPPHSREAERAVLGAILVDPGALDVVRPLLEPTDFYECKHALLYRRLLGLQDAGAPVNAVALNALLLENGELEFAGGTSLIAELTDTVPTSANADYFARQLVRDSLRRKLILLGRQLSDYAFSATGTTREVSSEAERRLLEVTQGRSVHGCGHWARELVGDVWDRATSPQRTLAGIPTGLRDLDDLLSPGLVPGCLTLVGGRTSQGKSSLGWSIALNVAARGHRVGIFSVEMDEGQLAANMVANVSRVPNTALQVGLLSAQERERLMDSIDAMSGLGILIDDYPGYTVQEMQAVARRWHAREGIELIVVDYVQLIRGDSAVTRREQVGEISRVLKRIARELKVPVLAMAQLNREPEKRSDKRPLMSDLREAGELEQDADQILLLWRPGYYDRSIDPGKATVAVAKNRNGPTGEVELRFEGQYARFSSASAGGPHGNWQDR